MNQQEYKLVYADWKNNIAVLFFDFYYEVKDAQNSLGGTIYYWHNGEWYEMQ